MAGNEWILWSVRVGIACYAIYCWRLLSRRSSPGQAQAASAAADRWWWTVTGLMFFIHFLAAFQFRHHWSHQHAFLHTAQRTGEMLGWEFGYGLYFNYLFLALWAADLIWWWGWAESYLQRVRGISVTIHTYFLFVIVNGAVVFVAGPTRWISLLILVFLGILSGSRLLGKTESPPAP